MQHCNSYRAVHQFHQSIVHTERVSEWVSEQILRGTSAQLGYKVPFRLVHSGLDWIEQCFTSPPTQYRLYGIQFLQVKRPDQQYQSTEGTNSTQTNQTYNKQTWTQNTASPLVYNYMGWLGDGSHRGQGCQARTVVGLLPRYPYAYTWRCHLAYFFISIFSSFSTHPAHQKSWICVQSTQKVFWSFVPLGSVCQWGNFPFLVSQTTFWAHSGYNL